MKKILALDMASRCGWAFRSGDGSIASGVTPFLGTLNPGSRWLRFDCWLDAWADSKPDLIVYEEPIVVFKHKQGLGQGFGFEAILRLHCARKEIRCEGVNISALKKWATGDGRADKWKMVRFARQLKPDVSDDNEADAILLLEYARKRLLRFRDILPKCSGPSAVIPSTGKEVTRNFSSSTAISQNISLDDTRKPSD